MPATAETCAPIDAALKLVVDRFQGLTDEDGEPYILHCLRVMMAVEHADAQLVALMHDLVEDTDVTIEELRQRGFSEPVVEAIDLVTRKPDQTYAEYVVCLSRNELARQTKLADLRDNASLARVLYRAGTIADDSARVQRYILSHQFLLRRIDETTYRKRMLDLE